MATKKRQRRLPRIPRQLPPLAQERRYYRKLKGILDKAKALVDARFMPSLPRLFEEAGIHHDAAAAWDGASRPMGAHTVHSLIDDIKIDMYRIVHDQYISQVARDAASGTNAFNRQQMKNQFQQVLGVDPIRSEPWLAPKVDLFAHQNAQLIKSIPDQYLTEIEDKVKQGMSDGRRWEDIAAEIEGEGREAGRYDVAKNRAALIARDQVSKFNADLNEARQKNLGIPGYTWRTSMDEKVRHSHQVMEGTKHKWSDPPLVDGEHVHPGKAIQCRCTPEPDIEAILGEAWATEGPTEFSAETFQPQAVAPHAKVEEK